MFFIHSLWEGGQEGDGVLGYTIVVNELITSPRLHAAPGNVSIASFYITISHSFIGTNRREGTSFVGIIT